MMNVVDAVTTYRGCSCDCFNTLSLEERTAGIRALYKLDDAIRGWGFTPIYDVHGYILWREAQQRNDLTYRSVAVRFGECIYKRLLGSMLHECIHAYCGDITKANYGNLFGLPYAVPQEIPEKDEEAFLDPFNFDEARAWAGVWILGPHMFGLDWDIRTERDVGTYGFKGGNALVPPLPGYRAVAHIDRVHHGERYYVRARRLEERARTWFADPKNLEDIERRINEAAAIGEKKRPRPYPDPVVVAKTPPKRIGRFEPCVCGSAVPYKDCCMGREELEYVVPSMSR